MVNGVPTYETYNSRFMNKDLSKFLTPAAGSNQVWVPSDTTTNCGVSGPRSWTGRSNVDAMPGCTVMPMAVSSPWAWTR